MTRVWLRIFLVAVAVTAIGLLLDWLIETDREKIEKLVETCREAALRGDADGIMSQVEPTYSYRGQDFAALREQVANGLGQLKAQKILILDPRLSLHEDGTARFGMYVRIFRDPQQYPPVYESHVSLGLVKKDRDWFISSVDQGD